MRHSMEAIPPEQLQVSREGEVRMMPQDPEAVARSQDDLGFMTEVDPDYYPKKDVHAGSKESHFTDNINSTKQSDNAATSHPLPQLSYIGDLEAEKQEFKNVIREIVSKDTVNAMQMEERILERIRKKNLSKGWDRPTGVKVAPLRVLQTLRD